MNPLCETLQQAFISQGIWIFLGVICGALVSGLGRAFLVWWNNREIKQQIAFELNFNIKKIDDFIDLINKNVEIFRGGGTNFRKINLSKTFSPTLNLLLNSSKVYKFLTYDELIDIQSLSVAFGEGSEEFANRSIRETKDSNEFHAFTDMLKRAMQDAQKILIKVEKKFK